VVIVTGYGSRTSEERAYAAGVSDFLNKPLSPEMIEDSAARALAQAQQPAAPVAAAAHEPAAPAPVRKPNLLKNMLLFLMAPFVGLVYAVLLPFVGIGMLAWVALKKEPKEATPAQPE